MQGLHSLAWAFFMAEDNTAEIASLEARALASTHSVSTDGVSASMDLDSVAKLLRDARNSDTASIAAGRVRPLVTGMNLGGAF